jgi:hypothetical protein
MILLERIYGVVKVVVGRNVRIELRDQTASELGCTSIPSVSVVD